MRNKVAKEIRKFLKEEQDLDLSHKANEERGIRGYPIGEIEYQVLGDPEQKTVKMYRYVNPEKNYYRTIKKAYKNQAE